MPVLLAIVLVLVNLLSSAAATESVVCVSEQTEGIAAAGYPGVGSGNERHADRAGSHHRGQFPAAAYCCHALALAAVEVLTPTPSSSNGRTVIDSGCDLPFGGSFRIMRPPRLV